MEAIFPFIEAGLTKGMLSHTEAIEKHNVVRSYDYCVQKNELPTVFVVHYFLSIFLNFGLGPFNGKIALFNFQQIKFFFHLSDTMFNQIDLVFNQNNTQV